MSGPVNLDQIDLIAFTRTVYFFLQHSPLQFKVCAIFQLSVDLGKLQKSLVWRGAEISAAIVVQRIVYGNKPPMSAILNEEDELEQALALAEE